MEIIYREANENDSYEFEYVAANSWKDTYWDLLPQEYLINRINRLSNNDELEIKLNSIKEHIKNNRNKVFVALDNDKVVGILEIGKNTPKYKEYGHLEAIYVLPEYKGQKIGKNLFLLAIKKLIELGYNKMQLECMSGNDTINFYKKYGGLELETTKRNIYGIEVDVIIVIFENIKEILEENTKTNNHK